MEQLSGEDSLKTARGDWGKQSGERESPHALFSSGAGKGEKALVFHQGAPAFPNSRRSKPLSTQGDGGFFPDFRSPYYDGFFF